MNEKSFKKVLTVDFCSANIIKSLDKTTSYARLAQLAEHLTLNQGVQGSNP